MPSFKISVENQIQTILQDYVGLGGIYADPTGVYCVRVWDRKIGQLDVNAGVPLVAIIAKQTTQWQRPRGEIGTSRELFDWAVDIYYIDIDQQTFVGGYDRQDVITNGIKNALENEPRLRNLTVPVNPTSPTGAINEYVWNSDWSNIVWDNSGQEGDYYAFTAEMHLIVQTGRN